MAIKLVVSDLVEFPIKFTLNDAGTLRPFSFNLIAKRKKVDELRELIKRFSGEGEDQEASVLEMLLDSIVGWRNQTLVVDDTSGAPAGFTREGLELVLNLWGVRPIVLTAYLGACSDKGREKN